MRGAAKDRLRAHAPVDTFPPRLPVAKATPLLNEKKVRKDGRSLVQFRPYYMKTGVVSQASGSAYIEVELTKVIVAVYGPRHNPKNEFSEKGRVECTFKYAPFACTQRRKPQPDEEEEDLSLQLTRALSMCVRLEKYPKGTVDVYCLVLQDDGGALAAAICAGSLAMADAGIECFDLVAACQATRTQEGTFLDPSAAEELRSQSRVVVACMPALNEVTHMVITGEMEVDAAQQAINLCLDGCGQLHGLMRNCLLESAKKNAAK